MYIIYDVDDRYNTSSQPVKTICEIFKPTPQKPHYVFFFFYETIK